MKRKKAARIGRPPGKTHPENYVVRLPKGTLAVWRHAANREGLTVAGLIRAAVAERIERMGARWPHVEGTGALTWDDVFGGRIGGLDRKRK